MLITGCRQCGKTWLMEEFGRRYFEKTMVFNFEKQPSLAGVFRYDLDPARILKELGLLFDGRRIDLANTLIVFDEVQQCPEAVTSIKYFEESGLDLYLMCAGSLLGVELKKTRTSFPVGKIEELKLYPLDFFEFTEALGGGKYLTLLREYDLYRTLPDAIVDPMQRYLKLYGIIGGMPAAVRTYMETEDLQKADDVLEQIVRDMRNDFSKHADAKEIVRIGWIWDSVPKQLAKENNKFVFSHVRAGSRSRDLEDSLQWLVDAGLVYRLEKVEKPQVPLAFCADAASFKVYLFDVGIMRHCSGVTYRTMLEGTDSSAAFRGAAAENYCMTELISSGIRPYYWRSDNTAEVDFLFEDDRNGIVPLETKSAANTKAKSFSLFCQRYQPRVAFKASARNVGGVRKGETREVSLPLFLLWRLREYLASE